jgi:hypothetical protein
VISCWVCRTRGVWPLSAKASWYGGEGTLEQPAAAKVTAATTAASVNRVIG